MDAPGSRLAQFAGWAFWTVFLLLFLLALTATLAFSPIKAGYDWRFYVHIAAGAVFLGLAPFQFIGVIRRRFPRYHRMAGRVIVLAALLAIGSTFALHAAPLGTAAIPSQTVVLSVWLASILAAVWCIRKGDIVWHQRHMARAVVAASYFFIIRFFDRLIGADRLFPFESDEMVRFANSDWIGWLAPMIAVEIFMTLTTGRRAPARA